MAYLPKNRLHSYSRWPSDPRTCYDMATTDLEFVAAMHRCGSPRFDCPELNEILIAAHQRRLTAKHYLETRAE